MAKKSKRMELVRGLAERRKQEADQMLAASRARVEQDKMSEQQLQAFLGDYQQQYRNNAGQSLSVAELQNQQAFMQKITSALLQQQKAAEMHQRELQAVEQHWKQTYGKLKGMEKLVRTAREQEEKEEDKQLQKALDERSQLVKTNFI
ncbi:flagellar export protein FliJ [Marinobacterium jannaschii]|uniref:flagellar export protein FliJ n=1 Tax=Marinobacterium jannaschii TaxID=64970 RepID=UPI0009FDC901|nr:flagellar export protein FliJ [Marinobacterium jannaschii]